MEIKRMSVNLPVPWILWVEQWAIPAVIWKMSEKMRGSNSWFFFWQERLNSPHLEAFFLPMKSMGGIYIYMYLYLAIVVCHVKSTAQFWPGDFKVELTSLMKLFQGDQTYPALKKDTSKSPESAGSGRFRGKTSAVRSASSRLLGKERRP